jgi:pilus assembly protein CpaE
MIRAIIIGPDIDVAKRMQGSFAEAGCFTAARFVDRYPDAHEVARMVRAYAPRTVFLCADQVHQALAVTAAVEQTVRGLPIVAFAREPNPHVLVELMKAGVREFLPFPFEAQAVEQLAARIEGWLVKSPPAFESTDLLLSFLPAKAGVGTSTLAANLSVALGGHPNTRVLLADFDLNSGLVGFMLKVTSSYSISDLLEMSADLDESLWPQFVKQVRNTDVLPAGRPTPGVRIQPEQIRRFLAYARRMYGVICADLSGNLEKYSIELMQESKRVFLVTTPEIPPLHLARDRLNFLRQLDLGDRVSVLLNRHQKNASLSPSQIEDALGVSVYETFPNCYHSVHQSLLEGRPIDPSSDLGARIVRTAGRIIDPEAAGARKSNKKGFFESLSLRPQKYQLRA